MSENDILKLIQNDISYYAMHTNYDVLGMADLSGDKMNMKNAEILEVTAEGDIGKEDEPKGSEEYLILRHR